MPNVLYKIMACICYDRLDLGDQLYKELLSMPLQELYIEDRIQDHLDAIFIIGGYLEERFTGNITSEITLKKNAA